MAGVATGVMFVLAGVLMLLIAPPQGVFDSFGDYLIEAVLVVAFAGPLVAISGPPSSTKWALRAIGSGRLLDNLLLATRS
ncbi:MAG TPA: hypothetical protein VI027_13205 [Rubrobacteraceae bacterium]